MCQQRYRFMMKLSKTLPSSSPIDKNWPRSSFLFRSASEQLQGMHHRWRVCCPLPFRNLITSWGAPGSISPQLFLNENVDIDYFIKDSVEWKQCCHCWKQTTTTVHLHQLACLFTMNLFDHLYCAVPAISSRVQPREAEHFSWEGRRQRHFQGQKGQLSEKVCLLFEYRKAFPSPFVFVQFQIKCVLYSNHLTWLDSEFNIRG